MKTTGTKQLKLILLLIAMTNHSYGQKFTYFPLAVGNKWYFSANNDGKIYSKFEIEKDTILIDGNEYSKINNYAFPEADSENLSYISQTIYIRKLDNKIIMYPNKLLLDFNMVLKDTVFDIFNNKKVLLSIGNMNILGRNLNTSFFKDPENDDTYYDYSCYTDSIGFSTLFGSSFQDYFPVRLLGCVIDNKVYGKVVTGIKTNYENNYLFNVYKSENGKIRIKYSIPNSEYVSIKLYDIRGKEIKTIVNKFVPSGNNIEVELNINSLQKGIYLCELKTDNYITTKKLLLY